MHIALLYQCWLYYGSYDINHLIQVLEVIADVYLVIIVCDLGQLYIIDIYIDLTT